MTKIKNFFGSIKNWFIQKKEDIEYVQMEAFERIPFLYGHVIGCIVSYWIIVLGALIVSAIKGERYVWKLVRNSK